MTGTLDVAPEAARHPQWEVGQHGHWVLELRVGGLDRGAGDMWILEVSALDMEALEASSICRSGGVREEIYVLPLVARKTLRLTL